MSYDSQLPEKDFDYLVVKSFLEPANSVKAEDAKLKGLSQK
jgi:hypothetical protein